MAERDNIFRCGFIADVEFENKNKLFWNIFKQINTKRPIYMELPLPLERDPTKLIYLNGG